LKQVDAESEEIMTFTDWMTLLQWLIVIASVMFVVVLFMAVTGRLNAQDDDEPDTIIVRPAMNYDDNDWRRP